MATTPFTIWIDAEIKADLEQIAGHERRSASFMANLAIRNLVEERKAARELVDLGLDMVRMGATGLAEADVEAWLTDDDERPFPPPRSF
jgi:predicted transcriptional regulator